MLDLLGSGKRILKHYVGKRGLKRQGRKKWQRQVEGVVKCLIAAFKHDDMACIATSLQLGVQVSVGLPNSDADVV